jgi:hypothetical protein
MVALQFGQAICVPTLAVSHEMFCLQAGHENLNSLIKFPVRWMSKLIVLKMLIQAFIQKQQHVSTPNFYFMQYEIVSSPSLPQRGGEGRGEVAESKPLALTLSPLSRGARECCGLFVISCSSPASP